MKSLPWILNGVLAVAIVVLFVLHFTGSSSSADSTGSETKEIVTQSNEGSFKVGYVFIDSLLTHYRMYEDLTNRLLKRKENLENELSTKGSNLEKEIGDFQYKVQKRLITSWDAEEEEKRLTEKQQVLMNLQNEMQNQLMVEEQNLNIQIHDSVVAAVARFNQSQGFDLILSHTFGGGLLFAGDEMNVTREVLDLLNESYTQSKK